MITVEDLSVSYLPRRGAPRLAIRGVSLSIKTGEIVALLGHSGSGKSTLGLALCQALPPEARINTGYVKVNSVKVSADSPQGCRAGAARIAMIPQSPSLIFSPFLRCGTQVRDVLLANGGNPGQADARVAELLVMAGLPAERRAALAFPHELSGGELQRVAIARALAMDPLLLIADESTSALDAIHADQLTQTLLSLRERCGLAILWITHDPREIPGFADRVLTMHHGELVDEVSAASFQSGQVGAVTRAILQAKPLGWNLPTPAMASGLAASPRETAS